MFMRLLSGETPNLAENKYLYPWELWTVKRRNRQAPSSSSAATLSLRPLLNSICLLHRVFALGAHTRSVGLYSKALTLSVNCHSASQQQCYCAFRELYS